MTRSSYWFLTLSPPLTAAVIATGIILFFGIEKLASLAWVVPSTFFVLGKFAVWIPVFDPLYNGSVWELALLVTWMDISTAMVLGANFHFFFRLPLAGTVLRSMQEEAAKVLARDPGLRRRAFVGIALFVLFPVAGTGAVAGTILGRMLGMRPWYLVGSIATGAASGCFLMAISGEALARAFENIRSELWFQMVGIALVLVLLVVVLGPIFRRLRGAGLEKADGASAKGADE